MPNSNKKALAEAALMSGIYYATFVQMYSDHSDYKQVQEFLEDDLAKLGVTFDIDKVSLIQNCDDKEKNRHQIKSYKNILKATINNINGNIIALWFELAFVVRLCINMEHSFNSIIPSVKNILKDLNIPYDLIETTKDMIVSGNSSMAIHEFINFSQIVFEKYDFSKNRLKNQRVFIVHGHNNEVKETTARFLEKLGLDVTILHEQPNKGMSILEKIDQYSDVDFTVVILSDDDIGGEKHIEYNQLNKRARQNVIFELGFFIGKIGREKVCTLYSENVEIPSDYSGVTYIPIDKSGSWKFQIAKELIAAGFSIDSSILL